MRGLFVVFVFVVNIGCATSATRLYDGSELPRSQVAVLRDSREAGVFAVDETRVFGGEWALVPGEHEAWLKVRLHTKVPNVNWRIWSYCRHNFVGLSGEEYSTRVRTQTTVAPGIADELEIEVAIVDRAGRIVAVPVACRDTRPTFD
jgi:hypothetical protein